MLATAASSPPLPSSEQLTRPQPSPGPSPLRTYPRSFRSPCPSYLLPTKLRSRSCPVLPCPLSVMPPRLFKWAQSLLRPDNTPQVVDFVLFHIPSLYPLPHPFLTPPPRRETTLVPNEHLRSLASGHLAVLPGAGNTSLPAFCQADASSAFTAELS